jgi:hypothetical protein
MTREEWTADRARHRARVGPWVSDRQQRQKRQQKHPIYDFLFEYYFFRPSYLLRWSPGIDVLLEHSTKADLDWHSVFVPGERGWILRATSLQPNRREFVQWAIRYLEATGTRESQFACFGLHEWAMVYQEPNVRHSRTPLRLSREATNAVVEAGTLRCTHYDAYRFYTPAARPLNRQELRREDTTATDQPGCVHVVMDLYKWAFMLAPYMPSTLIADAFELALSARELDMRASPYDLHEYGFEPICIESREGREEYVAGQRELSERSRPIRAEILNVYRTVQASLEQNAV